MYFILIVANGILMQMYNVTVFQRKLKISIYYIVLTIGRNSIVLNSGKEKQTLKFIQIPVASSHYP